jgi:hypothetical protein
MILSTVFCSTEDIAVRASGDFIKLVPADQVKAAGADGVILAALPWVLTSASVPFGDLAVTPGDVIALWGARTTPAALRFGESVTPTIFAVEAVAGNALTLRRKGMALGQGQPAALADVAAVAFRVLSLFPQIERASYELDQRFVIDPAVPRRTPADLYDPRQLRDATVLDVLARLYVDQARQPDDIYMKKAQAYRAEFDDLIGGMVLRWRTAVPPTAGPFGARLSR